MHRLRVSLADIEPKVWREIEVDSTISIARLHDIIQIAFGWEDAHLWEFEIDGVRFGDRHASDDPLVKDAAKRRLNIVVPSEGARFRYTYDFGDFWVHHIDVLAIVPAIDRIEARCVAGDRACPPEDCGGPWGYQDLLAAIGDENAERHDDLREWVGADFDPEAFALDAINDRLLGRTPRRLVETRRELPREAEVVLTRLVSAGEKLSDLAKGEILELGDRAIHPLIAVLLHPDLGDEESPGSGWAPIHAVRLLAELRATDAIEPMLALLEETGWNDVIHDTILIELPKLGEAALEPALQAAVTTVDPEFKTCLLGVLARLGVRDERVFALLIENLPADPSIIADLADYGDTAALPLLLEHFDRIEVDEERAFGNQDLIELEDAIITLGGSLTAAQTMKLDLVRSIRSSTFTERQRSTSAAKIGRNEPCPCGSGKKYKRCHLDENGAAGQLQ